MFLCYAGDQGAAFVDRELYLPEEWIADGERCRAAAVPEGTAFATKPELARRMIERALDAGVAASWVAADEVYGNNNKLRQWLEERRLGYVLAVASDQRMRWPDQQQRRVDAMVRSLPTLAWECVSAGQGSKGERLYDWALIPGWQQDGWSYGLLARRSIEEQPEYAYYRFYAPTRRPRWRGWSLWPVNAGRLNRHFRKPRVSAGRVTTRSATGRAGIGTSPWPCWPMRHWPPYAHAEKKLPGGEVPFSVPELRHLLTRLLWRGWHGVDHLLHWSRWRRRQQFHALRCHYRKRGSLLPVFYLQL